MPKFVSYKQFQTAEQALELTDLLDAHKIPFETEDASFGVSDYIMGQDHNYNFLVKILPEDFTTVNDLLENQAVLMAESAGTDHFLHSFSNEELLDVISKPDEWAPMEKEVAKKALTERGIIVNAQLEEALEARRIQEISTPEKGSNTWTTIGYISAFLGGILGIFIGLNLWTSKKRLPNGEVIYVYTEEDRQHGKKITLIGMCMMLLWIYIRMKDR